MTMRAFAVLLLITTACDDDSVDGSRDTSAVDSTLASDTLDDVDNDTSPNDTAGPIEITESFDTGGQDVASDTTVPTGPVGGARPARVVLPLDYDPGTAVPVVLLLHGYSASGEVQDLYLGFSDTASRAGFLTIIPDGTPDVTGARFWNADPAWCCNFANAPIDDVGYLTGLVDEAATKWTIDPTRVYIFGHSNGGFMAHRLACAEADKFAAIASLAGSLPAAVSDCQPSSPVSMLQIHGTSDATIVYPGNNDYPGAVAITDRWLSYDGCPTDSVSIGDAVEYDSAVLGAETTSATTTGCEDGTEVALWTMAGSGHIPGVGGSTFIADVLTFFARHTKPQP